MESGSLLPKLTSKLVDSKNWKEIGNIYEN
jgi:hypothetical protein